MPNQETSNDIIVIYQNRIIFSSGHGRLTKHSKISATVAQVLTLFSQRIMEGEHIHFIRFENHRMIFLFSQDRSEEALVAIVLIPLERSARQVIPAMGIVLRLLEDYLQGNIEDAQNDHLDCFYQIISSPKDSLIVTPRSSEGILSALVLLTGIAHDLHLGVQQIASNLQLVDPNNVIELQKIVEKSRTTRVLSLVPLPQVEDNNNVLLFGLDSPQRQYFSISPGEKIYDVVSRVFGDQSNASKMRKFIANEEAQEIAHSISLLPKSEEDFVKKEILLSTVLQPGKDIIVTMSTQVMRKLRELAPSPTAITKPTVIKKTPVVTPDHEDLLVESEPLASETQTPELIPSVTDLETGIELAAEPDFIPQEIQEPIAREIPGVVTTVPTFDSEVLTRLDEARVAGYQYQFLSIPIILDTAPFVVNIPENSDLPYNELSITCRLFPGDESHFLIHIYTALDRLSALKESLEDLSVRIGGECHIKENHVSLIGPIGNQVPALRALLWLSIVEYLTQVETKFQELSELFDIPNTGSILIVPPKREFIKEKIPRKFTNFIEEAKIRERFEQDDLWTLGKTQDEILALIMSPLKRGNGVVFVASDENQEMEEIALFMLLISEICGIGFSRW
ncbi:MAG: hypothetical protein JSV04_03605 [Candidatus Heimdallarchaeota archaeon]|nr:MAG: hypothetical protein JSV04_03605 [Candidatus Heimdallarchaeota archaeon]